MTHHYCEYCSRNFRFKDLYDQHVITCEFFYRKKREKDRDIDTFEHLPTQQELYKLVQQLTIQCFNLQKDVEKMKIANNSRTKKSITETLNSSTAIKPIHSFEEWVMIKREVTHEYLECVYKEDLIAGIKMYITDLIHSEKTNMPMRTMPEKSNTIYVYSGVDSQIPTWKIMLNDQFERWITRISHRFLQEYSNIQQANIEKIYSNDDENEKNIIFMMKITGGKMSFEKRCSELKKFIVTGNLRL